MYSGGPWNSNWRMPFDLAQFNADGRTAAPAVHDCPHCNHPLSLRLHRCMYCDYQEPVTGFESVAR